MAVLFWYEIKKIFRQKILWAAVLLMTLVLAGSSLAALITGASEKAKNARQFSGRELDQSLIQEAQTAQNAENYTVFKNFINYCMGTSEHDIVDEKEVYEAREASIQKEMEQAGLTGEEQAYWAGKEASVKKPFHYEYEEGYAGIFTTVYVANFMLLLLVAIGTSGIFADEKINGTDQIIFSSVSKEKLLVAKLLAGFSTAFFLAVYLFVLICVCCFGTYGISGFDAPLQIRIPGCMLNLTIGEASVILFFLFLGAGIVYAAAAMLLSQFLNNRSASTAIMMIGMFLSMLNVPEKFGILSTAWSYLPGAYLGSWTFTEYRLVHLCGCYLNNLQAVSVFWSLGTLLFVILTYLSYRNYQVKGR